MTDNPGTEEQITDLAALMKPCPSEFHGHDHYLIEGRCTFEECANHLDNCTDQIPAHPELRVECNTCGGKATTKAIYEGRSDRPLGRTDLDWVCACCEGRGDHPATLEEAEAVLGKLLVRSGATVMQPVKDEPGWFAAITKFHDEGEAERFTGVGGTPTEAVIAALHSAREVKA